MKFSLNLSIFSLLFICIFLSGCRSDPEEVEISFQINGESIAIEDPWVRPGSEGRMSAGYFLITNFEAVDDTLTGISSNAARYTEIHESYEQEGGMMGMREVSELIIPAQSSVPFEPGGLHVMFIQLTESLSEGDEVQIILRFANQGDMVLSLPVRE